MERQGKGIPDRRVLLTKLKGRPSLVCPLRSWLEQRAPVENCSTCDKRVDGRLEQLLECLVEWTEFCVTGKGLEEGGGRFAYLFIFNRAAT